MPATSPSLLVQQVCTLLDRAPTGQLVVFVPKNQLGTALKHATLRARGHAAGLRTTTLSSYASSLAELDLRAKGKTKLGAGPRFFLAERTVKQLSQEKKTMLMGGQSPTGLVAPLARTFTTLREHGITPSAYRKTARGSARQEAIAEAFSVFEKRRRQNDFFDTSSLFIKATSLVNEDHFHFTSTQWAILNTVSLPKVKQQFVAALQTASPPTADLHLLAPIRNQHSIDSSSNTSHPTAPHPLAEAQFLDAPTPFPSQPTGLAQATLVPGADLPEQTAEKLRFWTATGTRREIEAIFEDIVGRNRSFDSVEIAYTTPTPYLSLLDILAERHDIPVSLSVGRSVEATRPGQALQGFFDWIADGGSIPNLIALLRAGLITFEAPIPTPTSTDRVLDARTAATLLAENRYGEDPTNHTTTLSTWIEQIHSEIDTLEKNAKNEAWAQDRRAELRKKRDTISTLKEVVLNLLSMAHLNDHSHVHLRDFAASTERFLERYGPTPAPSGDEDEHTPDEAARNRLIERLRTLAEGEERPPYPPQQLAGLMTKWLELHPYVRAQRPQPGRAHIVPLESAGVADREHLYVVGLDASSARSTLPDDPLLNDEQREALSNTSESLSHKAEDVDIDDWRSRQALARHEGTLTLSASTYDLAEAEDRFEAPLFLRLQEAASEALDTNSTASLTVHHPLASDRERVLSDVNRWTHRSSPSEDEVRHNLRTKFPWIIDGLEARKARGSGSYTSFDGLLTSGSYDELDPLSQTRPVTAGRLETYARSPYSYFLRYVLGVTPLDEPALDDVAWLDARERGALLHDTFRLFMSELNRRPTLDDKPLLRKHFDACLQDHRKQHPPPSEVVFATTQRQLWTDALLFLRVEAAQSDESTPDRFEVGFGYPPHRQSNGDYPEAPTIQLGPLVFALRGRIDRVDLHPDGTLNIWDYKTGSSRTYDETDLLAEGHHLQWALYAYALEELDDEPVSTAGYFFTNTDEMGKRISASPTAHRVDVERTLQQLSEAISAGGFPLVDADDLRYSFDRLFHSYSDRRTELSEKSWPTGRPLPPLLRDE